MTEKPETPSQPAPADPGASDTRDDGRIPRPAIWVAIIGLVASLAIYGLSFVPGSGSIGIEWDTIEPVKSPPSERVGPGSFTLARTSLSALAPNEEGLLIYRVAGVVRVDSGGRRATVVRCDVTSRSDDDTRIARSTKLRTAWPRPSPKLQAQAVPETSLAKFALGGKNKVDLPIRDVARRYTDSASETLVDWDGYTPETQNWTWTMNEGTGPGAATLPWVVIFEAEDRPKGSIDCVARIGSDRTRVSVPFRQQEWPIADDEANVSDASEASDAPDVE